MKVSKGGIMRGDSDEDDRNTFDNPAFLVFFKHCCSAHDLEIIEAHATIIAMEQIISERGGAL